MICETEFTILEPDSAKNPFKKLWSTLEFQDEVRAYLEADPNVSRQELLDVFDKNEYIVDPVYYWEVIYRGKPMMPNTITFLGRQVYLDRAGKKTKLCLMLTSQSGRVKETEFGMLNPLSITACAEPFVFLSHQNDDWYFIRPVYEKRVLIK